jgi:hypothetical protein
MLTQQGGKRAWRIELQMNRKVFDARVGNLHKQANNFLFKVQ